MEDIIHVIILFTMSVRFSESVKKVWLLYSKDIDRLTKLHDGARLIQSLRTNYICIPASLHSLKNARDSVRTDYIRQLLYAK